MYATYLYGEQPSLSSRGFQDLCVAACDRPPRGPHPGCRLKHRGCPMLLRKPPLFLIPLGPEGYPPLPCYVHPEHTLRVLSVPLVAYRGRGLIHGIFVLFFSPSMVVGAGCWADQPKGWCKGMSALLCHTLVRSHAQNACRWIERRSQLPVGNEEERGQGAA